VPHVHVHIVPRGFGDWTNNDQVYEALDRTKGVDNDERQPRTQEDMMQEALRLRSYFPECVFDD
jgi:bis(5'-adenosyl)-triphosphatase